MPTSFRLPVVAALGMLMSAAVSAGAQTVYARHAPPGRVVRAVVNRTDAGQATVDANGNAKIPIELSALAGKAEMDANVFVDVCADVTRIVVVENGRSPLAPNPGCERRDVQGLYAARATASSSSTSARRPDDAAHPGGVYTAARVRGGGQRRGRGVRPPSPTGLVLYAGGTFNWFRDAATNACGDVTPCTARDSGVGFGVGGIYWMTPWLGAEAGYLRPKQITANPAPPISSSRCARRPISS